MFDPAGLMAAWRRIEPRLRRQVSRFGVAEHDVDDVVSETFTLLFRASVVPAEDAGLVALADAVARRVVLGWQRREARRVAILWQRGWSVDATADVLDDAELVAGTDVLDEEGAAILRVMVEGKLPSLTRSQRRAVGLFLRGGPYTNAEKQAIFRGRKGLDEVFRDLWGGAVVVAARWRHRLGGLRFAEPNPLLPLLAGVAASVGLVSVAVSSAATGHDSQSVVVDSSRPMVPVSAEWRADPTAAVAAPSRERATTTVHGPKSPGGTAQPVRAQVSASLPTATNPKAANVTVARDAIVVGGQTWYSARVYCDTPTRQAVCTAWRQVPGLTAAR